MTPWTHDNITGDGPEAPDFPPTVTLPDTHGAYEPGLSVRVVFSDGEAVSMHLSREEAMESKRARAAAGCRVDVAVGRVAARTFHAAPRPGYLVEVAL